MHRSSLLHVGKVKDCLQSKCEQNCRTSLHFNNSLICLAREPEIDNYSDYDYDDDSMEAEPPQKRTVPTVFTWENGGREVLLSGSFNDWKTRIPMNLR